MPPFRTFVRLAVNLPWLVRAVWWRYVHKRLLFPAGAQFVAHVVVEQAPSHENRITLSDQRLDALGVPLAEISWRVTDTDIENLHRSTDLFEETWVKSGLSALGDLKRFAREGISARAKDFGGIYHPTGSTRMGASAEEGCVDPSLRLFAFPQIQLLATSVLPTGGGANPTMMLLLLAMRCVHQHRMAINPQDIHAGRD